MDRLNHTWIDPRGLKKEEWEWAELNAYHSADVAKQLLDDIESLVVQAEYLRKKERGEIDVDKFDKFWGGTDGTQSPTKA